MATGHVRKRGKKWTYVQYVKDPATGKGKYRWKSGFDTKTEAQRAGYHDRDLVFARPDANYLHPERFSREFKRAQARYNRDNPGSSLTEINLHALRHGWATVALEAGVPMKVVQDRLNHASERITADIYTHVRAPLQSDAAERVAGLILP